METKQNTSSSKQPFLFAITTFLVFLSFFGAGTSTAAALNYGNFQDVRLTGNQKDPAHVILYAYENKNVGLNDEIANSLAAPANLVIQINVDQYFKALAKTSDECVYPAGDFETLSQYLQRKLGLTSYRHPILVGHGRGASLVYGILAEAPQTFPGAISIEFRPDFSFSKDLCAGKKLRLRNKNNRHVVEMLPVTDLKIPWIVINTDRESTLDPREAQPFVEQVDGGQFNILLNQNKSVSLDSALIGKLNAAIQTIDNAQVKTATIQPGSLGDLPIVELACPQSNQPTLAVIISGDGGWAGIDSDIGELLVKRGISVVGLDALKYFWTDRTPEGTAADLSRIIEHYTAAWNKSKIVLIGYSRGADVMPFLINRLPESMRSQIQVVALLGIAQAVSFEFHLTDWISGTSHPSDLPIMPEMSKLGNVKTLCFYGESEDDTLCPELEGKITRVIKMAGGHHFNGDYTSIVETILGQMH
jgi:type IV secretory pathway VirJ component